MSGILFGIVGAPVVSLRHFGATPVDLLTDAETMKALIRRRQGRAHVRGRPRLPGDVYAK